MILRKSKFSSYFYDGLLKLLPLLPLILSVIFYLPAAVKGDCLEPFNCQMDDEKRVVTCNDDEIDALPMCLHPRLLRLSLHKTRIKTIYSLMFYSQLIYLNLSNNQITDIDSRSFSHLLYLKELYLADNKISVLDSNTFVGLHNLTILSLKGNLLEEIPESVFYHMPLLEYLDLSHNRITTLQDNSLRGVPNLTRLFLSDNRLTSVPSANFRFLPHLASLTIGGNNFTSLQKDNFANLSTLVSLDLSNANLSVNVPTDIFQRVSTLRVVNLDDCQLQEVPSNILRSLPHLEELTLRRNLFKSIPSGAFAVNEKLRVLIVTGCPHLERISEGSLMQNINLEQLVLSKNPGLTFLPLEDFRFLPRLSLLDLHGNNLQLIPQDMVIWSDVKEYLIYDNPLYCNCSASWLREALLKSNFSTQTVTCGFPPDLEGVALTSTFLTDLSCGLDAATQGVAIGLSICGLVLFIGCIAFILLFKNRTSCIRQLLKGHRLGRSRSSSAHRSYGSEYPCIKPIPVTEL